MAQIGLLATPALLLTTLASLAQHYDDREVIAACRPLVSDLLGCIPAQKDVA